MPRKTPKPRKAAKPPLSQDTLRRRPELKQLQNRQGFVQRQNAKPSGRPMRMPGRLGGR